MSEDTNNHNAKPGMNLRTVFAPEGVRAKKDVRNWPEAVRVAGKFLVEAGYIESRYIDAMEKVIREIGPYVVIAPGIVLLHARPEDGVIKPCFGLVTLSNPVAFGHSQNDPVDLIFVLGAIDKNGHIQALQSIANFLGEPLNLEKLRAAGDDESLFAVIQSWSGSGQSQP